jgi:hypothetical protein
MQTNVTIQDLTEENLSDAPSFSGLPYSCKYCLYWESPEDFKKQSNLDREYLLGKKSAWIKKVRRESGDCGKIIYINEKPAGYAQYALPVHLPNTVNYSVSPDQDAVLIACLYIAKEQRVSGLGSQLLRCVVDGLRKSGFKAVETFAGKNPRYNTSGPIEFYVNNGFILYIDTAEFSLMRLEL